VALNASDQPTPLELNLSPHQGIRLVDLLNDGQTFPMRGSQVRLDGVPPYWARILLLQ
jgi:hypothetical protein